MVRRVLLTDDILDRIDEVVPPGADVGALDPAYTPMQDPTCVVVRPPSGPRPDHQRTPN
jgi:hypothetical protein